MTPKFEFILDKEANFIYWAQLLLGRWSWYFEKDNSELFTQETGILSEAEKDALEKLRSILQKENNQYSWLWQRYGNRPLDDDASEKTTYRFIRNIFNQKFESFWNKELPLLQRWRAELEEYDFNKLGFVFRSIAAFLGTAGNAECVIPTRVKLLISGNFPSGASRFNFGDLIILNVSRVPVTKKSRVIGALIHEFTHLINNKIGLLPKIIKTINYPNINVQEGYKWQYFVTETILKSISSHRANAYVGEFLDFDDETKRRDEDVSYKLPLRKYGYEFLIRVAASRFLSQTINYIETGKIIDAAYVNNAVNILANLLQEREEETAKET